MFKYFQFVGLGGPIVEYLRHVR